jgi:hypothetical protein
LSGLEPPKENTMGEVFMDSSQLVAFTIDATGNVYTRPDFSRKLGVFIVRQAKAHGPGVGIADSDGRMQYYPIRKSSDWAAITRHLRDDWGVGPGTTNESRRTFRQCDFSVGGAVLIYTDADSTVNALVRLDLMTTPNLPAIGHRAQSEPGRVWFDENAIRYLPDRGILSPGIVVRLPVGLAPNTIPYSAPGTGNNAPLVEWMQLDGADRVTVERALTWGREVVIVLGDGTVGVLGVADPETEQPKRRMGFEPDSFDRSPPEKPARRAAKTAHE